MSSSDSLVADRTLLPLRDLMLEMPHRRTTENLLRLVVDRLSALPEIALARIWLLRPGDICQECTMRSECPDQTQCLHLLASGGESKVDPGADWSRTDGMFRRFPRGVRKVGSIGELGAAIIVEDVRKDSTWIARPKWAAQEGIRGFAGQPLKFHGETLGVMGVFARRVLDEEWVRWLRVITDHAAGAIVNAQAFEEIEHLKDQLELENAYLKEEVVEAHAFGEIVGTSPALEKIERQIALVAPTDASVLIQGESGTGKELVAREIHRRSGRADKPLIKVNCASIPRELYESEFFGHVKGAFTGAVRDRAGRFEAADGGTLLLDEIGEIPLDLQAKLLRVLQEGEYERIGTERTRTVDVRVLAASNRDLLDEAEAGRFRSDLYYRLNVFPIEVPPLRKRTEDIAVLAAHFLREAAARLGVEEHSLTAANVRALQTYHWPGNVRELRNVIERAVITAGEGRLRLEPLLPPDPGDTRQPQVQGDDLEVMPEGEMARFQRANIRRALERTGGKVYGENGAAELLGIKPTTLASRMKKMGIERQER
jgi:transcriptional regulator with GAF, ATPase, and Fis domain